jgi:pimeloyl-ACP methyl ester carboxylesterase
MASHLPSLLFSRELEPTAGDVDALVLNCIPEKERAAIRDRFIADSGRAARQAAIGVYKVKPRDVRVPFLVVGAEHDQFIPCKVAARIARKYGAPLHVAEGHAHFLFAEPGWKRQVDVILDWIDALPRVIRMQSDDIAENSGGGPRITLPHLDQTGAT